MGTSIRAQYFNQNKKYLMYAIWFLLVFAAAGPQWLGAPIELSRSGRNLMLALDLSGSMQIPDMEIDDNAVDRLTVVKKVASEFVQKREGDRLGLILFGSRAYLQTPLTFDVKTVQMMLQDATIGLAGTQTALGDAIGLAVKRLMSVPEKNRVLILLTDGASNSGAVSPLQAAELAEQNDIKIYTIGIGANKMIVPGLLGPEVINPSADLDEDTLQKIADLTGGMFFRAKSTRDLARVYKEISKLEPTASDTTIFRPATDYYYIPLAIALLLSMYLVLAYYHLFTKLRAFLQMHQTKEVLND